MHMHLERAKKHDIKAVALSPKDFETRDLFNEALYNELVNRKIDLIVLAGCLGCDSREDHS